MRRSYTSCGVRSNKQGQLGSLIGRFLHVRKILKLGTSTHLAMSVIHLRKIGRVEVSRGRWQVLNRSSSGSPSEGGSSKVAI